MNNIILRSKSEVLAKVSIRYSEKHFNEIRTDEKSDWSSPSTLIDGVIHIKVFGVTGLY
ncbi:hypothetical protein BCU66_000015 [Vibrio sp. 10N.286.49.B1]|uniref:hypothetical protein n=1 Tax=unclassified Vibrio TaxID=2614977 RepID=UPI0012FFD58F|nr:MULTISPECIES: hypothetical protein [unclassified Vibrio]